MKNINRYGVLLAGVLLLVVLATGCEPERIVIDTGAAEGAGAAGYAGYHVGYSWAGEARDVALEDANSYIETILRLDEDANILEARMRYFQRVDGFWSTRQAGNAQVQVDFSVNPTAGTLGSEYVRGDSMFSIYTVNPMSLYAVAVDGDGTVAAAIVEPLTRYQFEMKFPPGFDFGARVNTLTINSGLSIPTTRTSGGAFLAPDSWDAIAGDHLFNFHFYSHVLYEQGVFAGIGGNSTIRQLLEAMGVEFSDGRPVRKAPSYGYFGLGGWEGNYNAIARYLVGRNARDLTSLVDWSPERRQNAINERNQFGVDVPSGATRTVQNSSVDGIAGATVRMSRESTSYQRALVDAGIIEEEDVIIGRF
ncbi:MAG: hypothetical protein EA427_15965 [Spirochaetaceae bacterium]|nr:MAG: hypothetical protein EA427_15965 [Spirochaetaceae bacterium]